MARQLVFDLPVRPALGRDDFFVSSSNAAALTMLDSWTDWPGNKLLLVGPAGAGKTHLACVWASETGARVVDAVSLTTVDVPGVDVPGIAAAGFVVVEDVQAIARHPDAQTALFHLHNLTLSEGGRLLLTANAPPAQWGLSLPDLVSRMHGTTMVRINGPDDALLNAMLVKLFADRQLAVPPGLISWLVPRMERSQAGAARVVDELDALALSEGRSITRDLARTVLDKLGQG